MFEQTWGRLGEMAQNGQHTKTHGSRNLAHEISLLPSDELEVSGGPFQLLPVDDQDEDRSASTVDSRYNLLRVPSLDDIHQDRHFSPIDHDVLDQASGVETDTAGILADMPGLITISAHGMAPSESNEQKHRQQETQVRGRVSYRSSEISDIAEPQEGSTLQTSSLPDRGHPSNGPAAASLQPHQIHQIPLQQWHLGGPPLIAHGAFVDPRLQQQAGLFTAPSFPNNVMMMMMTPVSMQSMGQTRPTAVIAGPSILVPLQQPLPPSVKPDTARVPERSMTPDGWNPSEEPTVSSGKVIDLFLDYDSETLTEYQCLLRKQIELFEAGPEEILASAPGRNISLGQVGIRCRYCACVPLPHRSRGSAYYSKSVDGLYQAAQNMSKVHLCTSCRLIPPVVRNRLAALQQVNRRAAGGKEYWGDALRVLGVYEDGPVMRFRDSTLGKSNVAKSETDGVVVEADNNWSLPMME